MIVIGVIYLLIMIMDFYPIIKHKKVKHLIINLMFIIPGLIFLFLAAKGIIVKSWITIIWEFLKSLGISY
ncbi:MAG TPA: hypothetical protein PKO43_03325 [Bacilli bacterium]|nr:hypothetical protein [Bacilli bacterium]